MKRKINELSKKERIATLDALYTAAGTVRGRKAMKRFMRELLTESERVMLGRRILIARLLMNGHGQEKIMRELKVGADTVWRVKKWLRKQLPGYENAIKNLEREYKKRENRRGYTGKAIMARLKKSYPLHFLLFPPYH
ncbi:MAG: Trp family transcriptional regulator [Candidatus Paceibacteria bacterium]